MNQTPNGAGGGFGSREKFSLVMTSISCDWIVLLWFTIFPLNNGVSGKIDHEFLSPIGPLGERENINEGTQGSTNG
jgi:hypothetical protein